jgi:hypothetical protein
VEAHAKQIEALSLVAAKEEGGVEGPPLHHDSVDALVSGGGAAPTPFPRRKLKQLGRSLMTVVVVTMW